jgi:hypothetical protein
MQQVLPPDREVPDRQTASSPGDTGQVTRPRCGALEQVRVCGQATVGSTIVADTHLWAALVRAVADVDFAVLSDDTNLLWQSKSWVIRAADLDFDRRTWRRTSYMRLDISSSLDAAWLNVNLSPRIGPRRFSLPREAGRCGS